MGVFIDYAFHIKCPEPELLERMGRFREKLLTLPFDSVSPVLGVDPAYQPLLVRFIRESGCPIPAAVRSRLKGKAGARHTDLCIVAAPSVFMHVPMEVERAFYKPAMQFCKTTTLWREEDLPEKVGDESLTYFRRALAMEFAAVMLRHGHLILVQPCEGCATFAIGLTSYRTEGTPCWLGSGFTKTQYATRFVEAHESICAALDFARDEGLLLAAEDSSGFYGHRDWSKSAGIVNIETTFARAMGGLIDGAITDAKKRGVEVEDISDPATRNYNRVRAPGKGKNRKGQRPRH